MIQKFCTNACVFLISVVMLSVSAKDLPKPALMLANIYQQGVNLDEYWVSEKYDGVRALWDGEKLISRGGNIYHAPKWFIKDFPRQKLDGELWIDRQSFELVVSTVRDGIPDDNAWKRVKFMVFDMPESPIVFDDRLKCMKRVVTDRAIPWLKLVKQWKVDNHADLMNQLDHFVSSGAEGLMLHRGSSFYKGKRTGDLLKVKQTQDAEAIVLKHFSGKGKYTDKLGAILVEMPNGIQFKIGSGFSDYERSNPPPIGQTITYQYIGKTKKGVPRFASFLRLRKLDN